MFDLFERFVRRGILTNRGWAQQLYWGSTNASRGKRMEQLVGSDPLNNSLIAMWGFLQAAFGVRISLASVEFVAGARAPPQMEGATWTFSWRGEPFCVRILDAKGVKC